MISCSRLKLPEMSDAEILERAANSLWLDRQQTERVKKLRAAMGQSRKPMRPNQVKKKKVSAYPVAEKVHPLVVLKQESVRRRCNCCLRYFRTTKYIHTCPNCVNLVSRIPFNYV